MHKKLIIFNTILIFCLMISNQAKASTYYFSSSIGSDTYTEVQAKNQLTPWKSIMKLNSIMSSIIQPGDSVLFKRGDIFAGTISIGVSGYEGSSITFSAYGAGIDKPILDNRLTLNNWLDLGNNIWETTDINLVNRPSALTINDVLKPLGRYPNIDKTNRGYLTIKSHVSGSTTVFTDTELSDTPNWKDAEAVVRSSRYTIDRKPVLLHSGSTITLSSPAFCEFTNNFGYFFQNHPSTLDVDGEWCYMATGKKLQLYSTVNPENLKIKVANSDNIFSIYMKSNIVIDGLTLIGAKENAFNISYCTNIIIQNCDIKFSGINAISISGSSGIDIRNNNINYTQSNCVNASGTNINISGNIIKNTAIVPGMAASGIGKSYCLSLNGSGLTVEQNIIDSVGYIPIRFATGNDIYDVLIKENIISHYCSVLDDGGAIYFGYGPSTGNSSNRRIINNIILSPIGASAGTNTPNSPGPAEGIYMDDHASQMEISGNTVVNCPNAGIYLHNANLIEVKNNTVYGCGTGLWIKHDYIAPTYPCINEDIQNNILVSNTNDASLPLFKYQTINYSELSSLGVMNNNIFFQPFVSQDYIRFVQEKPVYKSLSFKLSDWQSLSGYDLNSSLSNKLYKAGKRISSNGIINSTMETNINSWTMWNPAGNTSLLTSETDILDGNCISLTVTGTGGANSSRIITTLPQITKGKYYLLKFSAKASINASIDCWLIQNSSPFTTGSTKSSVTIGTNRTENEVLFLATTTLSVPSLFIMAGGEDGTLYLDNIEFYEVELINPADCIRLEYNATSIDINIIADTCYITPTGAYYPKGSTITVNPFKSVVLLKTDVVSETKSINALESSSFLLFPNPAKNSFFIRSTNEDFALKVELFDINGKKLTEKHLTSESAFNIEKISQGFYFVRVSNRTETQIFKLQKI